MCGIFGVILAPESKFQPQAAQDLIGKLYRLSQSRGKEASGVAILRQDAIDVAKAPVGADAFVRSRDVWDLVSGGLRARNGEPLVIMGHARMVTNGGAHNHDNNQPVLRDHLVCIHNGIIVNDAAIWRAHADLERRYEVDTEAFLALVQAGENRGDDWVASARNAMRQCLGANSIALMNARNDALFLASTNGSLYWALSATGDEAVFASERFILEQVLSMDAIRPSFDGAEIVHVAPRHGFLVDLRKVTFHSFSVDADEELPVGASTNQPRAVKDHPTALSGAAPKPFVNQASIQEVERLLAVDEAAIRRLRRCSRCVLPETFPFICFDADGVCNYCQQHKPLQLKGDEALLSELTPRARASGEKPRVLMPLSGGRDSCYGLHYAINELGLEPVAYTYDWGMVTDLARRNISRMCGSLKVEHVLVSANITQKREYIRMNVAAWLRKPHLGTIPLFMAGDKQFFYYANLLKKQMRLDSILFSMNPLERTDFKVGFCGINESYAKEMHYNPTLVNKARLAAFYGGQFLSNPGYLNASLLDSLTAYVSYYFINRDYASVFNYIPWEENKIEKTLLEQYDWETSPDTKSTWRIGDGTASFYNYIYYKVAGFTENDTFRSNQIREGLLTRDVALERLPIDNRPRAQSIREYFDAIKLNAADALRIVNKVPALY